MNKQGSYSNNFFISHYDVLLGWVPSAVDVNDGN